MDTNGYVPKGTNYNISSEKEAIRIECLIKNLVKHVEHT